MTREQLNLHWELIKAFKEGANIEAYHETMDMWLEASEPIWGIKNTYRIKPEEKLIPFTLEDAALLIGKIVTRKEYNSCAMIIAVYESYVVIANEQVKYNDLLLHYNFIDNTPCGKMAE